MRHNSASSSALLVFAAAIVAAGTQPLSAQPNKEFQDKLQLCAACHGESGVPQQKTTPIIWGQRLGYLYLQLKDFKRGDRKDEQMTPVIEQLEVEDLLPLATYYSEKPWPHNTQPQADEATALKAGRANAAVGCTGCHQHQYRGEGTQARLAGQSKEYMLKVMLEFRNGVRTNNPGMTTLMKATSEDDITALADYMAGLVLSQ